MSVKAALRQNKENRINRRKHGSNRSYCVEELCLIYVIHFDANSVKLILLSLKIALFGQECQVFSQGSVLLC